MPARRHTTASLAATLLLALTIAAPSPAWARRASGSPVSSRTLERAGDQLFARGHFGPALTRYRAALRARTSPELLYKLGECHRLLGEHGRAIVVYREYLRLAPRGRRRALVRKSLRESESKLRAHPPGAPRSRARTSDRRGATSQPDKGGKKRRRPPRIVLRRRLSPAWFWAGLAVTSTMVLVATASAIIARQQHEEFHEPNTPVADLDGLERTGRALEATSWVAVGVGVAAAIGTGLSYWLSRPVRVPVTATATSRGRGALFVARGRF